MQLFFHLLSSAAATVFGVYLIVRSIRIRRLDAAIESWPVAEGRILGSTFKRVIVGHSSEYRVTIAYEYTVNGQVFTSSQINAGGSSTYTTERQAQEMIDDYPAGTRTQVQYDPANPEFAALEPGDDTGSGLVIAIGVGAVIWGIWSFVQYLRAAGS